MLVVGVGLLGCGGSDDSKASEAPPSTRRPSVTGSTDRVGAVPRSVSETTVATTTTTVVSTTSAAAAPTTGPATPRTEPPPATEPEPEASPPPATEPPPTAPSGGVPASVLDLANWKITLPVAGPDGDAQEVRQPQLASFSHEYFRVNGGGVMFTAPVIGATTSGSKYPRSELREMAAAGSKNASWSSTSGTHVMEITQAITQVPTAKPHVVAGQIHDSGDDVVMIRLEGNRLFVEGGGDELADLDSNYALGTPFTVRLEVSDGHIRVQYNGEQKLDHAFAGDGLYFKAGVYTQSNADQAEPPGAAGQVVITALRVEHR